MKLGKIVDALPALQKLGGENLTPKTLYWVSKLLSKLDDELSFYNKEHDKIIQELGSEVEGGKWQIPPENSPEFARRLTELANIEIDGDFKVVKIPLTEQISLSYADIRLLEGLVELDLPEEENKER